jgi:hypothetical protein
MGNSICWRALGEQTYTNSYPGGVIYIQSKFMAIKVELGMVWTLQTIQQLPH